MIGADAIIKCLEAEGVSTVFGYPGVAICPFFNSILDSEIKTVLIRTEQNAAHAASGVARMTGRPGVCAVTSGPGATNLITGIATAFADSIPLVCITGQVNSELLGSDVFQLQLAMPDKLTAEMTKNMFIAHGSDIYSKLMDMLTQPGTEDDRPPEALL